MAYISPVIEHISLCSNLHRHNSKLSIVEKTRNNRNVKMDFINKLTHRDEEENVPKTHSTAEGSSSSNPQVAATTAAHAEEHEPKRNFLESLIAGSGHHHGGDSSSLGDDDERLSFLDKLTRKEDREKKMLELVKREAEVKFELEKVAREKKENEGLLERIKDHFDGDEAAEPPAAAAAPVQQTQHGDKDNKPSFFDKLTGKQEREKKAAELATKETALRAELTRIEHEKRENAGILDRIKQHLDQDEASGKSAQARDEDPSFFDKITGRAAEAEQRRKEEESKSTLEKMKDRINEGMGGGAKAEKEEDLLDKTIDGFQEHVLRKGDQSDESAIEQLKDERIAAAIRGQLHLKEKEDKE